MVRFLTYSNMFDIEGLVATISCWQRNKVADWRIHEIVDAYGKEAGTYDGKISIEDENRLTASFIAPEVQQKETIHIILFVKDSGNPSLTRYQRVIITVIP